MYGVKQGYMKVSVNFPPRGVMCQCSTDQCHCPQVPAQLRESLFCPLATIYVAINRQCITTRVVGVAGNRHTPVPFLLFHVTSMI